MVHEMNNEVRIIRVTLIEDIFPDQMYYCFIDKNRVFEKKEGNQLHFDSVTEGTEFELTITLYDRWKIKKLGAFLFALDPYFFHTANTLPISIDFHKTIQLTDGEDCCLCMKQSELLVASKESFDNWRFARKIQIFELSFLIFLICFVFQCVLVNFFLFAPC